MWSCSAHLTAARGVRGRGEDHLGRGRRGLDEQGGGAGVDEEVGELRAAACDLGAPADARPAFAGAPGGMEGDDGGFGYARREHGLFGEQRVLCDVGEEGEGLGSQGRVGRSEERGEKGERVGLGREEERGEVGGPFDGVAQSCAGRFANGEFGFFEAGDERGEGRGAGDVVRVFCADGRRQTEVLAPHEQVETNLWSFLR